MVGAALLKISDREAAGGAPGDSGGTRVQNHNPTLPMALTCRLRLGRSSTAYLGGCSCVSAALNERPTAPPAMHSHRRVLISPRHIGIPLHIELRVDLPWRSA